MAHTYEELHKMTVAQLREVAKGVEHPAVQGYSQLHKEQLLLAVCEALGVDPHEHHEVVGINKSKVKAQIRELKNKRAAATEVHDKKKLKEIRKQIRKLKRRLRKATV